MRYLTTSLISLLIAICTTSARAATLDISAPADGAVVCGLLVAIQGGMNWGTAAGFISTAVDYRPAGTPSWTNIRTITSAPNAGAAFLGTFTTWDTTGLASGTYYIRVTLVAANGAAADFTTVYIDRTFPTIVWNSPVDGAIVRGQMALDGGVIKPQGTSSATFEWKPIASSTYSLILRYDTLNGSFNGAFWNTVGRPDGQYNVRLTATDTCGNSTITTRTVTIDNTPPVVTINNPTSFTCTTSRTGQITGTISDAHIGTWTVDLDGVTVFTHNTSVVNSPLVIYGSAASPACNGYFRFHAVDTATDRFGQHNETDLIIPIDSHCPADFNRDGAATVQDIFDFLNGWFVGCP